jgi:histidyl-tRNA synthetase
MERMILELAGEQRTVPSAAPLAFVVHFSAAERESAVSLARRLRNSGLAVIFDVDGRSSKSQMRQASNSGAAYMLLIGGDEVAAQTVTVKRLADGEQFSIPVAELETWLRSA